MAIKNTELDSLRADLRFQLDTLDEIDWDYFLETAIRAKITADNEQRNMPSFDSRHVDEIVSQAKSHFK